MFVDYDDHLRSLDRTERAIRDRDEAVDHAYEEELDRQFQQENNASKEKEAADAH